MGHDSAICSVASSRFSAGAGAMCRAARAPDAGWPSDTYECMGRRSRRAYIGHGRRRRCFAQRSNFPRVIWRRPSVGRFLNNRTSGRCGTPDIVCAKPISYRTVQWWRRMHLLQLLLTLLRHNSSSFASSLRCDDLMSLYLLSPTKRLWFRLVCCLASLTVCLSSVSSRIIQK